MSLLDKAVLFASEAHKNKKRKGTLQDYIYHPIEVLSLASMMSDDENVLCAAVLHDTVEDTEVTLEDLQREFNERVAKLVSYETEDKRGNVNKDATWVKRKQETIDFIRQLDDIGGKIICLADKVSNLRSMHLGLYDHGDAFWDVFNMKDPKMHYWYYNSLKDELKELAEYSVYKEYCFLINAVFEKYIKG